METESLQPGSFVVVLCSIPTLDVPLPGYVGRILGCKDGGYLVRMQADRPPVDYEKTFGVAPKRKMFVVDIKPGFLAQINGNPEYSMIEIYRTHSLREPDTQKLMAQYERLKTEL